MGFYLDPKEGIRPLKFFMVLSHSLRAAFRTFLSDHKVDPLYIEYWMGHKLPEQLSAYINKSRQSWRQTYRQQAEPWLTPPQYKNNV